MNRDIEHLKILSTGYYIYGILSALFYLLPLIFVALGIWALVDSSANEKVKEDTWKILAIGLVILMYGQVTSMLTILTGKFINQRKYYLFCLINAGFNCIFFPIGTALGVFTFVVLFRETVKPLFNGNRFYESIPNE